MKVAIRALALIILIATLGSWAALGANLGWTKTSTQEMLVDPVTEIEYPGPIKEAFLPGVEFLALGIGAAIVLFGVSFLIPNHKHQ